MRARWSAAILFCMVLLAAICIPVTARAAEEALGTTRTSFTTGDTYTIDSQEELACLAELVNGGNTGGGVTFKLTSDITVTNDYNPSGDGNWTPIGYGYDFAGTFDGQGFAISGITVPNNDNMGLFSHLGASSKVKNLCVSSSFTGSFYAGGIAAVNDGVLENCINTGSISGISSVGGLVGVNHSLVIGCTNTGTITASALAGGISGNDLNDSVIQNCVNTGDVSTIGDNAGGITASTLGVIRNCYNAGAVTGKVNTGGIAGYSYGKIYNCYSMGAITRLTMNSYVGAIVGGFPASAPYSRPVVQNCFWLNGSCAVGLGLGDYTLSNIGPFTPENNGTLMSPIDEETSLVNVLNNGTIPGDKKWVIGTDAYTYPMMNAVAPSVASQPVNASVDARSTASFTATASGNPAPGCQWQVSTNGTTWSNVTGGTGATEETYTTPATAYSMNGWRYRCVFTNIEGEIVSSPATLTVSRLATTVVALPAASAITYGEPLSESMLTGGSGSVSGSFVWTDGTITPAMADSGTTQYSVTFLPDDSEHYAASTALVTLTVNKATPSVLSLPAASAITYGQTLAASVLSGGAANTPGSFAWTNDTTAPDITDSNTTEYSVTFTPDDADSYVTTTATVRLTVNKASTTVVALPGASAITFGQTLSASVLSGGSGSVPGSFVWTDGTIAPAMADSGITAYSVTFTPTDSQRYTASTALVTLTVNKATPLISSPPTASAITLGQTLAASVLSGGAANTPGSFAWTDGTIAPDVTDSNTTEYSVTFTPDDADSYVTTTTTVRLTVNKASTTVVTLPGASAITFGQTLSASVLSGGSGSVPGSFVWTNSAVKPTVADSGITAYSVTFTPTDAQRYTASTAAVTLVIHKAATTVVTLPNASAITYGQTLSASSFTGGSGGVPGSFSWTDGTTAPSVSDSGLTAYPIIFTPTDTDNYNPSSAAVTLVVNKATPVIVDYPIGRTITYGQTLDPYSVIYFGSANVPGSFAWTYGDQIPTAGYTNYYSVTFTPTDDVNYTTVLTAGLVYVLKANLGLATAPVAASITYGQSLADSVLSGGDVVGVFGDDIDGYFSWTDGSIVPDISDSNMTPYNVYFTQNTPSYPDNYRQLTTTVKLTVNKITPMIDTIPAASDITYGEPLSNSVLSGGEASVPGTFTWTNATAKPSVSDSGVTAYSVTFTPDDTAHYNTVTTSLTLTVNKAVCDMSGVAFADAEYAFDGNPKSLSVGGTLPSGVSVSYTGNGKTDAGVYTVTAAFISENYLSIPDMTATLTICPSGIPESYTMSVGGRVIWEPLPQGGTWEWDHTFFDASFNGTAAFTALEIGESVITYTVNGVTQRITVTVTKATYDMSGMTFADARYTYDGNPKSLFIAGALPPGVSVSYAGNERAEAGVYTVTASFTADSQNYLPIPDMTAKLTICPSGIPETYTMFVGGRAIWEPLPQGGIWEWDHTFFNAAFNSPATFTALKAGESVITYTVNGVTQSIAVTVRDAVLPETGQNMDLIYVFIWLAAVFVVAGILVTVKRRRSNRNWHQQ